MSDSRETIEHAIQCPHCGASQAVQIGKAQVDCSNCGSRITLPYSVAPMSPSPSVDYMIQVRQLVQTEQIEQAIRVYQQATGASYEDASSVINLIQKRLLTSAINSYDSIDAPTMLTSNGVARVGIISVFLIVFLFIIGIFALINVVFRSSTSFEAAMRLVNSNSKAIQALGEPINPGVFVLGSLSSGDGLERYNYSFPVSGPQRGGSANVRGTTDSDGIHMDVWLTYQIGGEDVTIYMAQGK